MSAERYYQGKKHPSFSSFATAAAKGNLAAMQRHFAQHGRCGHIKDDAENLLVDMISGPQPFQRPRAVLGVLEGNHVNFANAFKTYAAVHKRDVMKGIWAMHSKNPSEEMAKTAGVLLAEALAGKLMQTLNYKFDVEEVAQGIAGVDKMAARDSILATQNALANYVHENGDTMPINRGAGMLSMLTKDADASVSALWTQRMTCIKETTRYTADKGDVVIARPVYEPLAP